MRGTNDDSPPRWQGATQGRNEFMPQGASKPIIQHTAAARSRRRSFRSMGGAILATALPGLSQVEAKKKGKTKKGKKRNNRCTRDCPECPEEGPPVDLCVPQAVSCRDFAEQVCAHLYPPGPPTLVCAVAANLCCRDLGECEGEDVFACLAKRLPAA